MCTFAGCQKKYSSKWPLFLSNLAEPVQSAKHCAKFLIEMELSKINRYSGRLGIMSSSAGASAYTPPTLSRFFIFNPKYGPREDNDHEKILFFHPKNVSLDAQMKDVGLAEALTNITKCVNQSEIRAT